MKRDGNIATVLALSLLLACSEDPTQLLVVVDSDMTVPQELSGVKVEVRSIGEQVLASIDIELVASDALVRARAFRLPISFAIVEPKSSAIESVVVEVHAIGTSTAGRAQSLFTRRAVD